MVNIHLQHHQRKTWIYTSIADDFVMDKVSQALRNQAHTTCCGLLQRKKNDADSKQKQKRFRDPHRYCQHCRYYMWENGNIDTYFALFRGYRLDDDDVKVIKMHWKIEDYMSKVFPTV